MSFESLVKKTQVDKRINIFISTVTVLVMFFLFHRYTPFIYSTNDDIFLKSIVSGEASGIPNAHMIYSGYLLGIVLSFLYKMNSLIPWYGFYLVLSLLLCMGLILYQLLEHTKRISCKVIVSVLYSVILFEVLMQHMAVIQFTVVAAVVSATAIFWYYLVDIDQTTKEYLKANTITFLLTLLALNIRMKVFLMCLPFAGALWIVKYKKENVKKQILLMMGIFSMIVISIVVLLVAYGGKDWKEYRTYNEAREQIYDYIGYPEYDANKELYQEYGISYDSYIAASTKYNLLLDDHINKESMVALAKQRINEKREEIIWNERLEISIKDFVEHHIGYSDRPLCFFVLAGYLLVLLSIMITRKWRTLIPVGLLFGGRMITWIYIIYGGRYPVRITQSLFLVELIVLLGISIEHKLYDMKQRWLPYGLGIAYAVFLVFSGARYVKATQGIVTYREEISSAFDELKEYMVMHQDNTYYLDIDVANYYTTDIFSSERIVKNYAVMGSWIPKSPLYENKIRNLDEVYYVFPVDQMLEYDYFKSFAKGLQYKLVLEDTLITGNGTVYEIVTLENAMK